MHIIEQYALGCGAKISKPFIYEKYFPLPDSKYITLHTPNKFPSRTYDYWPDVVFLLNNILEKYNIKILQIGSKQEPAIRGCLSTNGQTDFNQLSFIVKNSILHLGVDSFPVHLASYYSKKIVALFSNMYPSHSGPIWSDKKDVILLESDKGENKPTYQFSESPKTINTIKPELIVNSVLKLLDINEKVNISTKFIGEKYIYPVLEVYPSEVCDIRQFNSNFCTIRMDYLFNEEVLMKQLSFCKAVIFTDKEIDVNILNLYKENIEKLFLKVSKNNQMINFIKKLREMLIKFELVTEESEETLNTYKINYMDFDATVYNIYNIKDLKSRFNNLNLNNLNFKSNKIIARGNQIYPSLYHLHKDIPVSEDQISVDNDNFIKDIEFFYFYKKDLLT